ncbi:MAG: bifunctional DNA primase/polymerase [bacterium]|nr:bifunctional DNA primase/polymerase [bacterium]
MRVAKNEALEMALKYCELGFSVIPVGGDKKPLGEWKKFQTERASPDQIRGWFDHRPDMNIGIVTGAISGIVVIDVEKDGSSEGFPPTVTAFTGGGGSHHYYKHPGVPVANGVRVRELIDIRGDGGYVVAPPSETTKGSYDWVISPWDTGFEELPAWVLENQKETAENDAAKQDWETIFSGDILEGMRNMTATKVAGKMLQAMPPEAWPLGRELFRAWNQKLPKPLSPMELSRVWKSIEQSERLSRKKKAEEPVKAEPRKRIAKCPAPSKPVAFEEWADTISTNFLDLRFASEVALSTVSQFLIKDITNPFALVLVDVPSSGKTIAINFFDDIPELTYASDKFTPASFVSNSANVPKQKLAEIDLLPRLQYRMFLIRDLATLFSKREEDLTEAIGTLTRVLDGEGLNTDTGVHGQRGYSGEYLFMVLAASTPIQPRVWKVMGSLGARLFFLGINSRDKDASELARQVVDLSYKEKEKLCRASTRDFLYGLWNLYPEGIEWNKKGDDQALVATIARCASLLASLRGVVNTWRDDFSGEFKYQTPVIEKPDRITQLFYNLARGHALVCGRTQISPEDIRAIVELCIDGAPSGRAKLFRKLIERGGVMTTSEVETDMRCSKPWALTLMKDLEILKVCSRHEEMGEDNEIRLVDDFGWFLSDECRVLRGLAPAAVKEIIKAPVEATPVAPF